MEAAQEEPHTLGALAAHAAAIYLHMPPGGMAPRTQHILPHLRGGSGALGPFAELDAVLRCGHTRVLESASMMLLLGRSTQVFLKEKERGRGWGSEGSSSSSRGPPAPFASALGEAGPAMASVELDALRFAPWADAMDAMLAHHQGALAWLHHTASSTSLVVSEGGAATLVPRLSVCDLVLNAVLRAHSRRRRLEYLQWRPVSEANLKASAYCSLRLESPHPYPHGTSYTRRLHFPGAPYILLTFDTSSCTESEKGHPTDYLSIFRDDSLTEVWGKARFGGVVGNWPGCGGQEPIVIPSDNCILVFHADSCGNEAGWIADIRAPVAPASVAALLQLGSWEAVGGHAAALGAASAAEVAAALAAGGSTPGPLEAEVEGALGSCMNDIGQAALQLCRQRGQLEAARVAAAEALEALGKGLPQRKGEGGGSAEDEPIPYAYSSLSGEYTVIIGREVLERGQLPTLTPAALQSHPDFVEVVEGTAVASAFAPPAGQPGEGAGMDSPDSYGGASGRAAAADSDARPNILCTMLSTTTARTWVQLSSRTPGGPLLNVTLWKGLNGTSSDSLEVPEAEAACAAGRGGSSSSSTSPGWKEIEDQYIAHGFPRWVVPKGAAPPHPPPQAAHSAPTGPLPPAPHSHPLQLRDGNRACDLCGLSCASAHACSGCSYDECPCCYHAHAPHPEEARALDPTHPDTLAATLQSVNAALLSYLSQTAPNVRSATLHPALLHRGVLHQRVYIPNAGMLGGAGDLLDECLRNALGHSPSTPGTGLGWGSGRRLGGWGPLPTGVGGAGGGCPLIFFPDSFTAEAAGAWTGSGGSGSGAAEPPPPLTLLLWLPPVSYASFKYPHVLLGQYYEAELVLRGPGTSSGEALLTVYQILDHGRTAQRCAVFCSDTRACPAALPPHTAPRLRSHLKGAEHAGGAFFGSGMIDVEAFGGVLANLAIGSRMSARLTAYNAEELVRDPFAQGSAPPLSACPRGAAPEHGPAQRQWRVLSGGPSARPVDAGQRRAEPCRGSGQGPQRRDPGRQQRGD